MLVASGTKHLVGALKPLMAPALGQFDFLLALLGSFVIGIRIFFEPSLLGQVSGLTVALLGVVLGAVLAGAAIQAAFLDPELLRNLHRIDEDPVRYLRPFLFTACLAVLGLIGHVVVTVLPPPLGMLSDGVASFMVAVSGVLVALPTLWCVLSLLPCMGMLVQFVGLKSDSALVDMTDDELER